MKRIKNPNRIVDIETRVAQLNGGGVGEAISGLRGSNILEWSGAGVVIVALDVLHRLS